MKRLRGSNVESMCVRSMHVWKVSGTNVYKQGAHQNVFQTFVECQWAPPTSDACPKAPPTPDACSCATFFRCADFWVQMVTSSDKF